MNRDPLAARFVTDDLPRFWAAFEELDAPGAEEVFGRGYLNPGTPGLHTFIPDRIGSAAALVGTLRAKRRYYASLRSRMTAVPGVLDRTRAALQTFAALSPHAVFPDTTFVMGRLNSGGTSTGAGLVVGLEIFTRSPESPVAELSPWERAVTGGPERLPHLIAHELIHAQQASQVQTPPTLLAQALREGAATFLEERISGGLSGGVDFAHGRAHEAELWRAFRADMHGTDLGGWLYQGDRVATPDLGYFVGARICRAYAARQPDERDAVRGIVEDAVRDPVRFLEESGYDG